VAIPRIIHQTWKDDAIPPAMRPLSESWRRKHPGWEYRLWTDGDNRAFIRTCFPGFLRRYDSYLYPIQRVDAVRYFLLYAFGGLYVDLDFECLSAFDELLENSECLFGLEPAEHCTIHHRDIIIGNALMAAAPKHPFLEAIIREVIDYQAFHEDRNTAVLETTGPLMLTRVYSRCRPAGVTLLPSRCLYPFSLDDLARTARDGWSDVDRLKLREALAVHYFSGTWWRPVTNLQDMPASSSSPGT
jgi:inositol phosphorylceramide mannosyltransferase catalytic subunit